MLRMCINVEHMDENVCFWHQTKLSNDPWVASVSCHFPKIPERSVCLLSASITTAAHTLLQLSLLHLKLWNRDTRVIEAAFWVTAIPPHFFLSQALPGPLVAALCSDVHWGHALVSCLLLCWRGRGRKEKRKTERENRNTRCATLPQPQPGWHTY